MSIQRFLFVTFDAGGNFPPVLTLGRELSRRGHRVTVLGHEQQRARVENAGLLFIAYTDAPAWSSARERSTIAGLIGYLKMFTTTALVDDAVAAARDCDLVVVDCMLLPIVAELNKTETPTVALFHAFYAYLDGPFRKGPIGTVATLRGVHARKIWQATDLQLVVSDQGIDPAGRKADNIGSVVWSGPAEPPAQPRVPQVPPRVLASLSTTYFPGQQRTLQRILDAAARLPIDLILTTGPGVDPAALRPPSNAAVHQFIPHRDVLPGCAAVVGHGGHSTTFQALAYGLPMVILPMHPLLDQPMVGKAVATAGAGLTLPKRASAERIATSLQTILDEPSYSNAAAGIAERLAAGTGTSRAIDRIIALLD